MDNNISIPRATQILVQWKLSAWEPRDGDSEDREEAAGVCARDKSLRTREQLNHVEIMSVYLKMIGREQKNWTVGGGETSESRGAAGVSQTDRSVLTRWWLKTAVGAWRGPSDVVNNIWYYLWALVVILSDSLKQQASLSWCTLHTSAPTPEEKKNSRDRFSLFHCFIYCCVSAQPLSAHTHCFIDSGVCSSLASTVSTQMRKHLEKSSFSMTSGCFLHTHTQPGDDSVVCVFRPGYFDVTTERKRRSSLEDHDNANWIKNVSCWCHG